MQNIHYMWCLVMNYKPTDFETNQLILLLQRMDAQAFKTSLVLKRQGDRESSRFHEFEQTGQLPQLRWKEAGPDLGVSMKKKKEGNEYSYLPKLSLYLFIFIFKCIIIDYREGESDTGQHP